MLTPAEAKIMAIMKKSLFRPTDVLELGVAYAFCFSLNLIFDYVKTIELTSGILISFFRNFLEYQTVIVILSTFLVVVFHYQFSSRKKTEVFCRILVGGTLFSVIVRYLLDCLTVLACVYLLSVVANAYLDFGLFNNLYLVLVFVVNILISAGQMRKYENI